MTDTELIDWLERGAGEFDVFIDRDPPGAACRAWCGSITVRLWPKTGPGPEFYAPTLREALEAAIKSQQTPI